MKIDNPAFNYNAFGQKYSGYRKTDPRIESYVHQALGDAKTVLNVGAGTGSYEPIDKYVVAVEPSHVMRHQRKLLDRLPAIHAYADALPFDDKSFDAVMAMVTVHHWPDMEKGLKELSRIAKKRVVVMTFDPAHLDDFWNAAYFPELIEVEKARYPTLPFIAASLGGRIEIVPIPIPLDCTDGFQEAFYGRPEAFLDEAVRKAQSAWGFLSNETASRLVKNLEDALISGEWDRKYGHYRTQPFFTCALRLVIAHLE